MGKAENHIEGYLYNQVKAHGGMCLKFISGISGVPDRIVILAGSTVFVETKAPGGKPRRLQQVRIKEMRACGADVRVIDTRTQVDKLVQELLSESALPERTAA